MKNAETMKQIIAQATVETVKGAVSEEWSIK